MKRRGAPLFTVELTFGELDIIFTALEALGREYDVLDRYGAAQKEDRRALVNLRKTLVRCAEEGGKE